jgi:transcription antitermination factor NusG
MDIVSFCNVPAVVSEEEIEAICKIVNSKFCTEPCEFLPTGQRVRINSGPLRGVEGVLVSGTDFSKVVVSINALQRSMAVEVFNSDLIPL